MKTQNKLENKARFFAEYWEQRIWRYKHTNGEDNLLYINSRTIENKRQLGLTGHLELSLLSAITDEHALEVANIIVFKSDDFFESNRFIGTSSRIEWVKQMFRGGEINCYGGQSKQLLEVYDFLRSKSYLIGWMDLTPEDIISYGWAQFKTK